MPALTPALPLPAASTADTARELIRALERPGAINVGFAQFVSAELRAYLCETVPERTD
ncbi:hypothetical protein HQQ81_01430 [Microbacteriaceae bacterium VKM Ac-2854]|nr:hypothetical protein [Microbacteriaceae bacterium VKM Ac-2854]